MLICSTVDSFRANCILLHDVPALLASVNPFEAASDAERNAAHEDGWKKTSANLCCLLALFLTNCHSCIFTLWTTQFLWRRNIIALLVKTFHFLQFLSLLTPFNLVSVVLASQKRNRVSDWDFRSSVLTFFAAWFAFASSTGALGSWLIRSFKFVWSLLSSSTLLSKTSTLLLSSLPCS